jgi:nucleoside-diphosphate-sugar epimerase
MIVGVLGYGFITSHIMKHLIVRGEINRVVCVTRRAIKNIPTPLLGVQFITVSIEVDEQELFEALQECHVIIHGATPVVLDGGTFRDVLYAATRTTLVMAKVANRLPNLQQLIMISSTTCLLQPPYDGRKVDESAINWTCRDLYSQSKVIGDLVTDVLCTGSTFNIVKLYVGVVLGEYDASLVDKLPESYLFITKYLKGLVIRDMGFSVCDVNDLVQLIQLILYNNIRGNFIVAAGVSSYAKLRKLKKDIKLLIPNSRSHFELDNTKLLRALPNFTYRPIADTLSNTINEILIREK